MALVALHFGSLTVFDNPVKSRGDIARELNVSPSVVNRACANYRKHGVVSRPCRTGKLR